MAFRISTKEGRTAFELSSIMHVLTLSYKATTMRGEIKKEYPNFMEGVKHTQRDDTYDELGDLSLRAKGDLERFKAFIETRVQEAGAWRGSKNLG
jgi:hypothetical protein